MQTTFTLKDDLLTYEKKYNKNSLRMYYSFSLKENNNELIDWKEKFEQFIFSNLSLSEINKNEEVIYLTIPLYCFKKHIVDYVEKIKIATKEKDIVVVLTNTTKDCLKIIGLLNEKGIITLLYSDDPEDKFLDYTTLLIDITNAPIDKAKKLKLKKININYDEYV